MLKRITVVLLCTFFAACSQLGMRGNDDASGGQSAPHASGPDVKFMENIAQANLAEIETGRLAVAKAQSPAVKQFGQHMIDEHSAMLAEGNTLAKMKGMPVPKSPDLKHQALAKKLLAMSGTSFDRAYMEVMLNDHKNTLELLQETATKATDPDLRAHARKAIPAVQEHLQMAQRLSGDIVGAAR